MSVLADELKDLEDDLQDSEDLVGEQAGPLDQGTGETLRGHLDSAESHVDQILDPNQNPSLDPPGAGSVDTSVNPSALPACAQACRQMATAAHDESGKTTPDHAVIGTKLRTIKHLLPAYRDLAGIT